MQTGQAGRPWRRALLRLVLIATVAYLFCVVMLALLQRSLIYFPTQQAEILPVDSGLPAGQVHTVQLTAEDGLTLHGWHVLPSGTIANDPGQAGEALKAGGPVILYFSGNAGNRTYRGEEVQPLADLGAHVVLFDYRGYGDNAGRPTEENLVRDAGAAWRYLTETCGVDAARIVLFGESLGGGVATRLAADLCRRATPPGGLILRCTFSSLVDVAAYHYPWMPVRGLMIDRFESAKHIASVTCPILQIHGSRDSIVPLEFGRKLSAAAPDQSAGGVPKQFVELPDADHNDILFTEPAAYRAALDQFLRDRQAG
jgi:fermentation-respiration switch protein FrsA (DUF1100 family)